MATLIGRYAGFGAAVTSAPIPAEVSHHAKRAVVDWFSTVYPGSVVAPATHLVAAHRAELGCGRSSLPGFATTAFPALAAWVNGSASHSVEFDDIFKDGAYHPGCPTIAGALAAAEDADATGEAFLKAVTVGYEISTRIAAAVQPSHYDFFHTTGTAGVFGSAAAAAAIYAPGNADAMAHALATAGTFASGLQQAFRSDSHTKPLHAGHAAQVGVQAGQAAAQGVTGALDLLEGPTGFGAAMSKGAKWEAAVSDLGTVWNIGRMTVKNHGCCGHTFAPVDGILALRAKGLAAGEVERIEVDSYRATLEVAGNPDPRSAAEARFSAPYVIAHALVHGSVRLEAFTGERMRDEAIRSLMQRVVLREDAAFTAAFPRQRQSRVRVVTKDGRTLEHYSPCRKGDPEAPLADAEIDGKYLELVSPVQGEPRARELLNGLWRLESLRMADLKLAEAPGRRR